jgi:hypothetical protein
MTYEYINALRNMADRLGAHISIARGEAHAAFDPLWKSGQMSRSQAYKWLAAQMDLPPEDCHMEKFTVEQCRKVVEICHD